MKRLRSRTSPTPKALRLDALLHAIRLVAFDFDGVFTDNLVYVFEDGREAVRCSRADGIGLRKLERLGITPVIVSTEKNKVVAARAAKLKIRCIHGLEDKLGALKALAVEMGISLSACAFVGNDINDVACLRAVGLAIVVQDAHPDVLALARYQTDARGGQGAVREVCDWFSGTLDR